MLLIATTLLCIFPSALFSSPVPPCAAPFPNSAVNETWCSTVLATNSSSGVTVAQYGLPGNTTLVTASTNSSIWYDDALFYLGGGIEYVFSYMAGANAAKESIIATARTVPFIFRPLSPLASPQGWWETSMLVSPSHFPDPASLPAPMPGTNVRLETLDLHTFATLDFEYPQPTGEPYPVPPYFTYFLRCDEQLAAGLPQGWGIKADSSWTPTWLLYNGQEWNGTWTNRCLAEVEPVSAAGGHTADVPSSTSPSAPQQGATSAGMQPKQQHRGAATTSTGQRALPLTTGAAPPACGVLLEFETFAWGAWAGPAHAPNVAIPDIDGGTDGLYALDSASSTFLMATVSDGPFFCLRLAVINISTGASATLGNNWPYAPPGFEGANGLFFSVDFSPALGFVVGMTEISKYGPLPAKAAEPGLPVGWTVVASVDTTTGASTALTVDMTPALETYPPLVSGLSSLDVGRSILWMLAADSGAGPYDTAAATGAALRKRSGPGRQVGAPPPFPAAYFLGMELSATAGPPVAIPAASSAAAGLIVCAFAYASAADALVSFEANATGASRGWTALTNAEIALYPVNGTGRIVIATLPAGVLSPVPGQVDVTDDGRFVYFGASQGSSVFEAPALITIDAVLGTLTLALAPSPDVDDYDVVALSRCA